MQMIGPLNYGWHHCLAHPSKGSLRRNVTILLQQRTFLLLSNCPFEVFVALSVELLFRTKSCHLHI